METIKQHGEGGADGCSSGVDMLHSLKTPPGVRVCIIWYEKMAHSIVGSGLRTLLWRSSYLNMHLLGWIWGEGCSNYFSTCYFFYFYSPSQKKQTKNPNKKQSYGHGSKAGSLHKRVYSCLSWLTGEFKLQGKKTQQQMLLLIYSGRSQRSWGDSHCPSAQDECLLDTCTYITLFYIYLYIHCIYTVIINKPGPCRKQRNSVGGKVKKESG